MGRESPLFAGTDIAVIPCGSQTLFRMQRLDDGTGEVVVEVTGMLTVHDVARGRSLYFLTDDADVEYASPEMYEGSFSFFTSAVDILRQTGAGAYLVFTRHSVYRLLAEPEDDAEQTES